MLENKPKILKDCGCEGYFDFSNGLPDCQFVLTKPCALHEPPTLERLKELNFEQPWWDRI